MRLRADWLRRVLTVPYVPTLGPVHPDVFTADLFDDIIAASRTGYALPFDRDRRWSPRKCDIVLVDEIMRRPAHTVIPTLPILVTEVDGSIAGAIGPLDTLLDKQGNRMLLPQYFSMVPHHRGLGHGRALWRAATAWGERHRAAYQMLQARTGCPSDRLFLSEGLHSLGFACSMTT